jgi:acetyl-CoA carboxylase biotin carboxyl carrier protein
LTRRAHHENLLTPQTLLLVDLKEIRTLIDLMKKNGLAVFKMEREGFKITLKTSSADSAAQIIAVSPTHAPAANSRAHVTNELPAEASQHKEIKSPMVGTFYAASSPEAAPYVAVGQEITPDTVVCIIEAMKVMNEIKAEISGVIAEVCAENGKPVQFGQALFRVK